MKYFIKNDNEEFEMITNVEDINKDDFVKLALVSDYYDCEDRYYKNDVVVSDDGYYFKDQEDLEKNCEQCYNCGGWFKDTIYCDDNGEHYCEDCCSEVLTYCNDCDEYTLSSNEVYVNGNICYVCDSCFEHYVFCEDTNRYIHEDGAAYCEECDCYYEDDDGEWDDGEWICSNCGGKNIKRYHNHKGTFKLCALPNEKTETFFGREIECECEGNFNPDTVANYVNDNYNNDKELYMFEHDGSLHNGYETITQPMSLEYIYSIEDKERKMFSEMIEKGCRSHDTTTCGLHIHFSRSGFDDEATKRLLYVISNNEQEFKKFSRRHHFNWCNIQHYNSMDNINLKSYDLYNHYTCVNLQNDSTIEIRLFRGTLNYDTQIACVELVRNLVEICKNKVISIENITFKDIVNYLPTKYLNAYYNNRFVGVA